MPTIVPTDELLDKLYRAQLEHTQQMIADTLTSPYGMSDDGFDYLTSALALAERMTRFRFDQPDNYLEAFGEFLNADPSEAERDGLQMYACDGIANAFYDLNPPSLEL